jgi:ribosomal protein S18 acetylase RimI-like enzyme
MKVDDIRAIYEVSFPDDERREFEDVVALAAREKAMNVRFLTGENGKLLGFIIFWRFKTFIFVEHFAIDSRCRGAGHGARFFGKFLSDAPLPVVLEVEPPDANPPMAARRIAFYERLGMRLCDRIDYLQPPYSRDKKPVPMRLMSFGTIDLESNFETVKTTIYQCVYGKEQRSYSHYQ